MTRRTKGPKRNAEAWASWKLSDPHLRFAHYYGEELLPVDHVRHLLAVAHQAGYRSAARKRRKIS